MAVASAAGPTELWLQGSPIDGSWFHVGFLVTFWAGTVYALIMMLRGCVRAVHAVSEPIEKGRRAPSSKIESLSYESAENDQLGALASSTPRHATA